MVINIVLGIIILILIFFILMQKGRIVIRDQIISEYIRMNLELVEDVRKMKDAVNTLFEKKETIQ